ncbi:MAG: dCTP deaminase [Candidatus Thermoplasmatota archaeon]|nr:dCTP deaminase [Candidatus Thermoplasmatota archaeon]
MGIFTDSQISEAVEKGLLVSENFNHGSLTPNGYDITIGSVRVGEATYENVMVKPGTFFLVGSREFFNFPDDVTGQIWIRSSYARKGLIGSFGFIDAGFKGNLTLSFLNSSGKEVEIRAGERIAQLVFSRLESSPEKPYSERSGNYQNSRGIRI